MISGQYTYKDPVYLKPIIRPVKYENYTSQSYQTGSENIATPESYQTQSYTYNQVGDYNTYNYGDQTNQIYTGGEVNSVEVTNQLDANGNTFEEYEVSNTNTNNYINQTGTYDQYDISNVNASNYIQSTGTYTTNEVTSYYPDSNNVVYQGNEIYSGNQINYENPITSFANNVSTNATNVIDGVKNTSTNVMDGVVNTSTNVMDGVVNTSTNVIDGAKSTASSVLSGVKNVASSVVSGVKNLASSVVDKAKSVTTSIVDTAKNVPTSIVNTAGNVTSGIVNTAGNVTSGIVNTAGNVTSGIVNTAGNVTSGIANAAGNVASGIVNTAGNVTSGIANTAGNVTSGIVNTTKNVSSGIVNSAQGMIIGAAIGNPISSAYSNLAYSLNQVPKITPLYSTDSSNMDTLNRANTVTSTDLNKLKNIKNILTHPEFKINKENEKENNQDSPRLINRFTSQDPPSPVLVSKQSKSKDNNEDKDKKDKETKKENENLKNKIKKENEEIFKNTGHSKILTLDEKILLSEKDNYSMDFNIKKHYEVTVVKEPIGFNYNKIHKKSLNLLSHFEMPQDYEYTSPIMSPNLKYLACIAHGTEDFVYIWDMKDLYWYRYKFSASGVDGITFTPDSQGIIIVYRYTNPIVYNLGSGKKIIELERGEDEKNRKGFQCTAKEIESFFAYTSDRFYTLWNLTTGKILQQIMNDSPIKIISNDYLICISSDLNCEIIKISTEESIISFRLKGVESPDHILDARCSPDMTYLLYVTKDGIIKYNFSDQEYKGVQKFNFVVDKATISDDCKFVVKTNMKHLSIHDLEKQNILSTFLKEKFKVYKIDFKIKRLIVIDEMCINILDYQDEEAPEKYVWLNKNPTKFEDVRFSRDCKILLARVNRNNAIAYDLKTGYILKKWQNIDENWIDFAITRYGGDKIATKSHLLLVRIWNFSNGREDACFYGYDSHSLSFSASGNYLACGTKVGPEIARIWDIYNQRYGIYRYNGRSNNFHTVVHLTSPEPSRLICCAIDQQPLIFDTNTKKLLTKCECAYRFEEIYEIDSDLRFDVFIIKGRDEIKRNIGILYRISDGALLEVYENYTVLELAKNLGVLVSKCQNVNKGKLTSTNLQNLGDPILNDFQIQADKCKLLQDSKTAVIEYGDNNHKEFNLINVENGAYIGQFIFERKYKERKYAAYITVDPIDNEIYFRYFEFLSPQETMIFKKKNIYNVEDETEQ